MIFVATSPEEWVAKSMDRLIQRSAWNRNSANFAFWVFSEVRSPLGFVTVAVTLERRRCCRVEL